MIVRDAVAEDMAALAGVFFRAVRHGAAPAYSAAQRAAWAAAQPSAQDWAKRLDGLLTLVGEWEGRIAGFMSLRMADGYLDLAFVEPEWRGRSVAAQIYAVLENRARVAGLQRLHTEASHMAKPFFARADWDVVRANVVTRDDQTLENWVMQKSLSAVAN